MLRSRQSDMLQTALCGPASIKDRRNPACNFFYIFYDYSAVPLYHCLGPLEQIVFINELIYQGTNFTKELQEMTISWSFSYSSFVKFHGNKFGSLNMTKLYQNQSVL